MRGGVNRGVNHRAGSDRAIDRPVGYAIGWSPISRSSLRRIAAAKAG